MNKILSTPRRLVLALVAAGAIGALGATGAGLVGVVHSDARAATSLFAPAAQPASPASPAGAVVAPNFADITARNGAAVVNISVVGSSRAMGDDGDEAAARQGQQGVPGMDPNDPFFEFFRRFGVPGMPGMGQPQPQRDVPMRGEGSGFIVSSDGLILTNAHVVRGEVVGINSQIYSRSGGYQGVSFAIPIEVATRVQQQIVATGKVQHARLGVSVQEVNQAFADSFKLDRPEGALVASVDKSGPAAKAGLEPGDVVRKVDGQAIVGSGDLPAYVGQALPGQKVELEVWRNGQARTLTAVLGDASDKAAKVAQDKPDAAKGKLGLALRPLQPDEKQQVGVKEGLVVADAAGPAAEAGITQGDVLLSINGAPAADIDAVRAAMAKAGKTVAVLIWRDGNRIFVPVRLG
jgi:S1-C subfamily serine protease